MPAGQPTKLTDKVRKKAEDYLEHYEDKYGHKVPTVFGLCRVLKIPRSTVYGWKDEEFSYTLDAINCEQARVLCDKGLSNEYNATIAKLMLANQGMSDKVDNTLTGPNGGPVEIAKITRTVVDPSNGSDA